MGTVRKTITLTEQQDEWIAQQIADGSYETSDKLDAAFEELLTDLD